MAPHGIRMPAQCPVQESRCKLVEPGQELFGKADDRVGATALDNIDDLVCNETGPILGDLEFAVQGLLSRAVEGGGGRARGDIEDVEVDVGILAAERLGESVQARLAGAIYRLAWVAQVPECRPHEHQRRLWPRQHRREQRPGKLDRRGEIEIDDAVDRFFVGVLESSEAARAGAMDQRIDRGTSACGRLGKASNGSGIAEIAVENTGIDAKLCYEALQSCLVAAGQKQLLDSPGETRGDRTADTAGRAGEQYPALRHLDHAALRRDCCGGCARLSKIAA